MAKPAPATCSLTGCFGCHMSFPDIDERLLELADLGAALAMPMGSIRAP